MANWTHLSREQQIALLEKDWAENPRWKGIKRGYTAADVVRLRGSVQIDHTLVDVIVAKYAPLPAASLGQLVGLLAGGVPQWRQHRQAMLERARQRLPSAWVDGTTWLWPVDENPASRRHRVSDQVRLLAPFDPVVWDRVRFEHFWGWAYRFEAYTPAAKRERGYYAMPLLWRGQVIGWGNVSVKAEAEGKSSGLHAEFGYVAGRAPRDAAFKAALAEEVQRLQVFLERP